MYNSLDDFFSLYSESVDLPENHTVVGPVQYHFTGDGYCDWYLLINGRDIIATKGIIENPFSIVECDADGYLDLKNGKVSYDELFKNNKMKLVKGIRNLLKLR